MAIPWIVLAHCLTDIGSQQARECAEEVVEFPWVEDGTSKRYSGRGINNSLRTLIPGRVNLFPKLLTPVNELLDTFLDVLERFTAADMVDFDGNLFRAEPAQNISDAGFQKRLPVPDHA